MHIRRGFVFVERIRDRFVMPGLVPGIHVVSATSKVVDGRDMPGHVDPRATDCAMRRSTAARLPA
ncbi:hypothetical protein C7G42_01655 [Bradyrhizobium sp. MOS003]|nr:hypothetical protein C7G42_01655 [Bradyrhizobium sp. MOS003]